MSVFDWPATLKPASMSFGLTKRTVQSRSTYSSKLQTIDLVAEYLSVSISLPPIMPNQSGAREAFLARLAGGTNWVRVVHATRQIPAGSMRGSPVTGVSMNRGDLTITINSTSGSTLMAGDFISIGGQLFMVADDVSSTDGGLVTDGSGNVLIGSDGFAFVDSSSPGTLVVPVVNRVRKSTAAGAAVLWDRPTATFIMPATSVAAVYQPGYTDAITVDLEEVW